MNDWLNANADGIAFLVILGVIGVLLIVGAMCIERLVSPRHERHFDNLARNTRGRKAMARSTR